MLSKSASWGSSPELYELNELTITVSKNQLYKVIKQREIDGTANIAFWNIFVNPILHCGLMQAGVSVLCPEEVLLLSLNVQFVLLVSGIKEEKKNHWMLKLLPSGLMLLPVLTTHDSCSSGQEHWACHFVGLRSQEEQKLPLMEATPQPSRGQAGRCYMLSLTVRALQLCGRDLHSYCFNHRN